MKPSRMSSDIRTVSGAAALLCVHQGQHHPGRRPVRVFAAIFLPEWAPPTATGGAFVLLFLRKLEHCEGAFHCAILLMNMERIRSADDSGKERS